MNCRHNNIFYAVKASHKECVRRFLDKGVSINALDNDGKTPLHHASSRNDLDLVLFLCSGDNGRYEKANVNIEACKNQTPLYLACRGGNVDIIRVLLENGADANYYAYGLVPPLHHGSKIRLRRR